MATAEEQGAQVSIRLARPADAGRVAILSGQLGYPTTPEQAGRRLEAILHDDRHAVWVALCDGLLVGWVHVLVRSLLIEERPAEIAGLVVDEAYRSHRIGELLVQQAERWARERGCAVLQVRSNVIRQDAHRFYRRLGFQHYKTQLSMRKELAAVTSN